jgi:hypothetical protein
LRISNIILHPWNYYCDFRVQTSKTLSRLRPLEEIRLISALKHEESFAFKIPYIEIGPHVEIKVIWCGFESAHESLIRTQMQLERQRTLVLLNHH